MIIFSLWNQKPIPEAYQECLKAWEPFGLQLIRGDSGNENSMLWSDDERFRLLSTGWQDEDVLYVDPDTVPGLAFDTLSINTLSFYGIRGGDVDICTIYRPCSAIQEVSELYSACNGAERIGTYFHTINKLKYPRISGYPDDSIIKHLNLSLVS